MKNGWTMDKNAHEIVVVAVSATALSAGTRNSLPPLCLLPSFPAHPLRHAYLLTDQLIL